MAMSRLRGRKSLIVFAAAVVVFAAFIPAVAGLPIAILTPLWLVVVPAAVTLIRSEALRCDEQPVALLSVVLSRAPPSFA
jgi:hypothetical protein